MQIHRLSTLILISITGVLIALALTPRITNLIKHTKFTTTLTRSLLHSSSSSSSATNHFSTSSSKMTRTPVYFISHGGPNTMYDTTHPAYTRLQAIGTEITQQIKPKAIVVLSAHWQSDNPGTRTVEINTGEHEPLLYDFYGFPKHYYAEKFPHRGSKDVAERVSQVLSGNGVKVVPTERGLDHGVFVPFKIMFDSKNGTALDGVPIVQISLLADEKDAMEHIVLGRALRGLRDEGIQIIVSGMAVHNLRHLGLTMATGQTMPYAVSFDEALKSAVESEPGQKRDELMCDLLKRHDARLAHPTFEHLVPIHVGVGAAGDDAGKQVWTLPEGSMSWAQFRFGEIAVAN